MAQYGSIWLKMARNVSKCLEMAQKKWLNNRYLRAKVFPSCEECVADHFRGLHELIDANEHAQNSSKWLYMALNGTKGFRMAQKYSRAKVFPSCEECVADHFRGLHELIDANGYLEWDFVRSSVAGEIDI